MELECRGGAGSTLEEANEAVVVERDREFPPLPPVVYSPNGNYSFGSATSSFPDLMIDEDPRPTEKDYQGDSEVDFRPPRPKGLPIAKSVPRQNLLTCVSGMSILVFLKIFIFLLYRFFHCLILFRRGGSNVFEEECCY
jgi:hypothetical protein